MLIDWEYTCSLGYISCTWIVYVTLLEVIFEDPKIIPLSNDNPLGRSTLIPILYKIPLSIDHVRLTGDNKGQITTSVFFFSK